MPSNKSKFTPQKIDALKKACKAINSSFDDILVNPVELSKIPLHVIYQNINNKNALSQIVLESEIINIYKIFDIIESARKSIIINKTPKIGLRKHSAKNIEYININNTKKIINQNIYINNERKLVDVKKMLSHYFDIKKDKQIKTKKCESDLKEYLKHLYDSRKEDSSLDKLFIKEINIINKVYGKSSAYQDVGVKENYIKKKVSYYKILSNVDKAYAQWLTKGMPVEIYVYCAKNFPAWRKTHKRQGGIRVPK